MKKIAAKGQLRHYFHGSYAAAIALVFENDRDAAKCLSFLGDGWKLLKEPCALGWYGAGDQLKVCEQTLGKFGADINKIASLKHSIDFGEPFEVSFEVVPEEQGRLF